MSIELKKFDTRMQAEGPEVRHLDPHNAPYYLPVGDEVEFRGRLQGAPAGPAQGPDRLRQDPLRRAHGAGCRLGPAGRADPAHHRRLPRGPHGQRSGRPLPDGGRRDACGSTGR